MNVNSYIFQSPYSSQIQVGRPNPSATSKESDQVQKQAPTSQSTPVEKIETVQPTNDSKQLLNIYA